MAERSVIGFADRGAPRDLTAVDLRKAGRARST
jgi:hypothetical protein